MYRSWLAIAIALAVVGPAVRPAAAIDLTGTWHGSSKCAGFDGTSFPIVHKDETLLIAQTGNALVLAVGGFASAGVVHPDDKKPEQKGQVGFVECSTTNAP